MNMLFKTLRILILLIMSFSFFSCSPTKHINKTDVIEGVQIQPEKALELAEPHLEEHATYDWNQKELRTHIVMKGNWYYIMRTNYPAKTLNYYLKPAVMVHKNSGKIKFSKK